MVSRMKEGPWGGEGSNLMLSGPVSIFGGMVATISLSLQLTTLTSVPLKDTVLLLCVESKPLPVMVTVEPTGPASGEIVVIAGTPITANGNELPVTPNLVTVTGSVVALGGDRHLGSRVIPLTALAVTPLILTWVLPTVVPKPDPFKVIGPPGAPLWRRKARDHRVGHAVKNVRVALCRIDRHRQRTCARTICNIRYDLRIAPADDGPVSPVEAHSACSLGWLEVCAHNGHLSAGRASLGSDARDM